MKQSTSFTQVANSIKNLLQGYTKGIRFLLVMFVALTVSAEVWGETYTWTCSGSTVFSTSGSSLNGVTWKASITGSSQGTGVKGEKCVQIAKNNSLTLETTDFNNKNITAISIQTWGSQENTFYLKDGVTQLESTKIPKSYSTNGAKIDFSNVGVIKTKLVFEWAKATNAFNVRSITVTYEEGITKPSVSFDLNGGNGTFDDVALVGNTYNIPETEPTRDGYNFIGWKIQDGNETVYKHGTNNATISNITESITLVAQWSAIKYTITYHLNGGSGVENSIYTIESNDITLPTPEKQGLTFVGWYANEDLTGQAVTKITSGSTGNKEFWAKWEKSTPTFAWSTATCTAALEADNTFPTLNNPNILPVTYTSSNTGVATIDENGNITLIATGPTNITATGAETATHKSATTTYELTVVKSNCKWVEVEIGDIDENDQVVIAMAKTDGTKTWALDNSETGTYPAAGALLVEGNKISQPLDKYIWNIVATPEGYVLYSYADKTTWLYCTGSSNTVKVGTGSDKKFVIENGYLKCSNQLTVSGQLVDAYIGVSSSTNSWRHYQNTTGVIAGQTLKFYKRECLDSEHYWVTWDVGEGTWEDKSSKKLESYQVGATITAPTEKPSRERYRFDGWTPTPGTMPAQNITFTAIWTQMHTITWMVGSNSVLTEEVANATSVTQTPDDPANDEIGNCADAFVGWSEKSAGSTPQDKAYYDDLCTAVDMQSKHSNVTGDKTFYAVFATKEGYSETTQMYKLVTSISGGKEYIFATGNSAGSVNGLTCDANSNLTATSLAVKVSDGLTYIETPASNNVVWNITGSSSSYNAQNKGQSGKYLRCYGTSPNAVIETSAYALYWSDSKGLYGKSNSGNTSYYLYYNTSTSKWGAASNASGRVYAFEKSEVTVDNTTYSNYVTNCCALAPATNLTISGTTANSATLTWTTPSPTTGITKLQVRNAETDAVVVDNITVNTTTATITGLTECTSYQYYVVSVGDCEVFSNTVTATPFSGAKTVNYNYNGGSGSTASFTTSCENQKIFLPNATRPGYTFNGWFDAESGGNHVGAAGAEYNPATSPITLYAQWTETNYTLTHNGSNYTNTENKTTIKSSETPFTLHYTCTGDYGLPATISITGGGKSWTVGTDYTWEVAADKQSATLTINQTTITADVTITINVATRYTVTFIHNDKGIFDGSETLEVLSTENTITLPNITNVSCGFYDTFEGWIVANEDYTESTSKPAGTIYKGGANYTVNSDCTLRALYSKCEGDAKQVYRKIISTAEVTDGTYILVANTATPLVYCGDTAGMAYGDCISGLTADGSDFSNSLPDGAVPVTVSVGVSGFSIHNGTKFIEAGTSTGVSDNASYWQLTDGSKVNSKDCPQGVLQPINNTTYVLQKNNSLNRFKTYENSQSAYVFLYKLIDKCTRYYSTNPSCEKPVGVHIVYNANAVNASMSCSTQDRTYKVENEVNKYPQLASQLQFCTNATREGYTLVGWNTQANGQGTTYNINQNYYNLPVSGELDGEQWITLNLYAMWKPCIKFNLGNAIGGTGVPDAVVENGECVLPEPTPEQLGRIPCGYEFYAWSETSVQPTQTKPALFMAGDTYSGDASTLHAVYRLCEVGSNPDLFSLSYTIGGTKYYVGPVTKNQEGYTVKFIAITDANNATVFGMKSIEGKTYKSLYWMNEETKEYMYWKNNGASFIFTSEEDKSYGWTISGTTELTFLSTPYINNGSRYLSADASEIGCPSELKAVTQFTKEMASTMICTYATEPECSTTATLQFVTNGGTLNYPTTYDANSYQNLTPGTTVYLPTATFAGEWVFEGWKRGSQLESQTLKPNDPSFYSVTLNDTQFEVDGVGTIYFYAVYSKTKDDKQFDPVNGGTYKLFAIGEDGTKTYMPIWNGGRGTMSGVTTCAEAGDYTITPGTDTHAGQYQITCGEHTLGVVGDIGQTDLNEVEGTWWNINPSISGKGTWRITVVGSSNRALSALSKSFGNYSLTQINNVGQPTYRDMEIGECIYTEYTSTPENIPYITITGAPVKITSTNGESIYAPTTLHIEAHNFTGERIIHLSATNGFGVDPEQVRTNGQGAYSGNVKVYYEPTTDGDGQTITTSVLTASQKDGTNAEKINQTFAAIQGRNMPANFIIAAKWDGHWYALPANCTSSLSSTEGLLIEVDDVDNPTVATAAPAFTKYGLREVIPSRQKDHGQGVVFTERFAKDNKQFALYNGSDANIQVNAQYANYAQTNPDKYEWIPSTSDFKDYTLTNASTGRNLGLTSGTFGAYTAASNQVRLLPATFYDPATAQVLKWKANSVIVMYTGAETTATTQVGDNAQSAEQTLANQEITHGIYELTTDQALTSNDGGTLSLYFGANTRVELEIPLIISGEVTASANAHDVVILENSKLTAAATRYSYKDVYVYGGAKLAIPENTELGVNNIILRAGGVATNGAGQEATYQYIYPQVELKGTLTSSVQNIRYEYVTDYDHWYHLVLPFDGSLTSIHYPYEYYGDQVKLDNTGSWQIKRYAGEIRATGNYNAWKDIENDEPKATTVTAGKGYIFWGAPKKVSVNGGASTRQKWGIQRITMSVSAPTAKTAENGNKTIAGLGSYENVPNNSRKDNDQGWNLIGNPYMVNLTTMSEDGLRAGKLVKEMVDDKWTGKWINNGENLRYLTIPSEHFETYEAKTVSEAINANALVPGRAFFVQLEGEANGITFAAANRASLMPALLAENNDKPVDIETGIVLSNETLQDEVNFWIKDGKTNDYEYNADYPKTPNNNRFNIYGVHTNGDLSWVATGPEYAAESMPIGYQVPAAGTYMLSLSEIYNSDGLNALYVTDHALLPEVTVDIMSEPYEFSVNQAETNNERFTVSVRVKAKTENGTTGLGNVGADGEQIHKFIYQDKIYILHHGGIYDATGKRVITINK